MLGKDIDSDSSKEEVVEFFKNNFKISEDISNKFLNEYISGDILQNLSDEELKYLGLKDNDIIQWHSYYDKNKDKFKEDEIIIKITLSSTYEEVKIFLETYLNIKEDLNIISGKKLLELTEEDMKKLGMKLGQRKKLIKYNNKFKQEQEMEKYIKEALYNDSEEKTKILINKLNLSNQIIEKMGLNKDKLFFLQYKDIIEFDLQNKDKKNLEKFIEKKNTIMYKNKYKIEELNANSKYNIFFIIHLKENYYKNINISFTKVDENQIEKNLEYRILKANKSKLILEIEENELFIIQIQLDKLLSKSINYCHICDYLYIIFKNDKKEEKRGKIKIIDNSLMNYFSFENPIFEDNDLLGNQIFKSSIDSKFNEYYKFFFENKLDYNDNIAKDFFNSLLSLIIIDKISLSGINILKILKLSIKFKYGKKIIEQIKLINLDKNIKSSIGDEYVLSDNDIDNLSFDSKMFKFLLNIYIISLKNKENLPKIILDSKYNKNYSLALLSLLRNQIIMPKDFSFPNNKIREQFQNFLLDFVSLKREIKCVIELSHNLENALEFMEINHNKIIQKIYSLSHFYEINYYTINLSNLEITDNFGNIMIFLNEIFKMSDFNSYHLIDFGELFIYLDEKYYYKNIDIYCQLLNYITSFREQINIESIENFYNKIHEKGMNMIKNNEMEIDKIIIFMSSMDVYYFDSNFINNDKRDPEIMKYIPITDINPNYLKYIESIKKFKLFELFLNPLDIEDNVNDITLYSFYNNREKKFYSIVLNQIKKIIDLKNIFYILSTDLINIKFTILINEKVEQIKNTILDVNFEKYLYIFFIFDNLININIHHNLDIKNIIDILFINKYLSNEYFIYRLKNKFSNNEKIVDIMKDRIFKINLEEYIKNKNPDSFMELLINSDDKLCLFFLSNIDLLSINENEFYQKDKNIKFIFLKAFLEKCKNIYDIYKNTEGLYTYNINLTIKKIINNLINNNIKFNDLLIIMEDNEIINTIKLILGEKEVEKLYNKLKNNYELIKNLFKDMEIIIDYYSNFYPKSKGEVITILKKNLKEYKEDKKINEIINIDFNNFCGIKNFYLKEKIEESKNIRYQNSSFFIGIYKYNLEKYKSEKSEYKLLIESIDEYINIMKEIIEKSSLGLSLFEIKNIELIVYSSLNLEFDLDKEIKLIKQEFSYLNKNEYISNNFKIDFIEFIRRYEFTKLIEGINKFMEYYYKINEKKETSSFNCLRTIYNFIINNNINEEVVIKCIESLKSNEYYFNNENILIKFYMVLLGNKESLSFLEKIKDSIINKKRDMFLNSKEINGLLEIYSFFKNILNKKEINSDKDFFKIYNDEISKNNNIITILAELKAKFINFIKKDLKEENNLINNPQKINETETDENINSFLIQFDYEGCPVTIQGNLKEKFKNIISKFIIKTSVNIDSIFFLYGGKLLKEEYILSEIVSKEDKNRNKMNILVASVSDDLCNRNNFIIKSKEIICPKCFELSNLKIKNYRISLSDCKNGHEFNDMLFKNFLISQNINLAKIICNNCTEKNKFNSYNNEFYKCFTCNNNLCPLCKSKHDKSHNIINYEEINSICKEHIENYNSYCKICKINLCLKCEKDHITHEKIYYGSILPDVDKIKTTKNELEKNIKQLNKDIDDIIKRLNEYKENINHYCQIYVDIMKNIENKNRTYETLNNIIEISNNDIIQDLKSIIDEKDIKNKFNLILDITDKKGIKNNDEITLIYKIDKNVKSIKIFDSEFVNNNKNICKIIHENKETELKEYINVESEKEILEIKLKGINQIANANKMFYECSSLLSIPDFFRWDLSNINQKLEMFKGCNKLSLIIPETLLE